MKQKRHKEVKDMKKAYGIRWICDPQESWNQKCSSKQKQEHFDDVIISQSV